jgi:hypothetical protein
MSSKRPRAILAIGILAIGVVLGNAMAAVAGPPTQKAIKKIVNKQVKKLAPRLSVARAGNADALGGAPASAYLPKSGVRADGIATSSDLTISGSSTFAPILTKTFTAPADGYIFVVATLSSRRDGGATSTSILRYSLVLDGAPITTDADYHTIVTDDATFRGSGAVSAVLPVSAGPHTVALQANDEGVGSIVTGRDLSMIFTPSGSAPVLPY